MKKLLTISLEDEEIIELDVCVLCLSMCFTRKLCRTVGGMKP